MVFRKGESVWVKGSAEWVWEVGVVEEVMSEEEVIVVTKSGRRMLTNIVYKANVSKDRGYDDMTTMTFVNEATILSNLHRRSVKDRPYTNLGSVMVAVNPMKEIIDPNIQVGHPSVAGQPHPFAVAESAFLQLRFACSEKERGKLDESSPVSQTIVVGGESGAGKTESSKRVLQHLVARCGGGELDARLLGTNPILEAFGNAQTLRNPNSSRFGKMMRLHFDASGTSIIGASIDTYLLERSRVTSHDPGERSYHIFYMAIAGMGKDKNLGLSAKAPYGYLTPGGKLSQSDFPMMKKEDDRGFTLVMNAFEYLKVPTSTVNAIFKVVAGILHMGNIVFVDVDMPQGKVAHPSKNQITQASLTTACTCLGFSSSSDFLKMFTERVIKVGSGDITAFNDAKAAKEACDAVAKTLYSRLFNYILDILNNSIDIEKTLQEDDPKIGVLDIFGFESFQHNGFEQLLINYTNESLQSTFNDQIFHAELDLYRKENLIMESEMDKLSPPKTNEACMELLESKSGILTVIDQQGQLPQPSDKKMNDAFHRAFRKNPAFGKVHPKDIDRCFVVMHYAGSVTYTVGSFLARNADTMPESVDHTMQLSSHPLMADVWASTGSGDSAGKSGKKKASIVSAFKGQIVSLKSYLDSTRCTFIRCIKPNPELRRDSDDWFDRRYVMSQLKALSILSTAEVLKNGFPTRVAYSELVDNFLEMIPDSARKVWEDKGSGSDAAFVKAILAAFDIEVNMYKLGRTRVFFKSGKLAEVTQILNVAEDWKSGGNAKVNGMDQALVMARFEEFFERAEKRGRELQIILTRLRVLVYMLRNKHEREVNRKRDAELNDAAIVFQKRWRGFLDRKVYRRLLREHDAQVARKAEEARLAVEKAEAERKEKQARLEKVRQRKEALEQERIAAQNKQKQAEARLEANKKNFQEYKSNYDRLMEKRKKQMAHLDGGMDFLTNDADAEAEKREEIEREKEALQELDEQNKLMDMELQEMMEEEEGLSAEVENLSKLVELTKEQNKALFDQWKSTKKRLDQKRQKQREELEAAMDHYAKGTIFDLEFYLDYVKSGSLVKEENVEIAKHIVKAKMMRDKNRRPSAKVMSMGEGEYSDDEEEDGDKGYAFETGSMSKANKEIEPYLNAIGEKLPVKGSSFKLFNRWAPRKLQLDTKALVIRYFHIQKSGAARKKQAPKQAGAFYLNDLQHVTPSRVTKEPPKYHRRGKTVLMIENGGLESEKKQMNGRGSPPLRTLIIALSPKEADEWFDALKSFTEEGRPRSSDKLHLQEGKERDSDLSDIDEADLSSPEGLAEIHKVARQAKILEGKYNEEEMARLLANPVLRGSDDEDDEENRIVVHCTYCAGSKYVSVNQELCEDCGNAFRK